MDNGAREAVGRLDHRWSVGDRWYRRRMERRQATVRMIRIRDVGDRHVTLDNRVIRSATARPVVG
jgi:hypothetical protein